MLVRDAGGKIEAMVKLGQANSRMKDFYDLAVLSQTFAVKGELRDVAATIARFVEEPLAAAATESTFAKR